MSTSLICRACGQDDRFPSGLCKICNRNSVKAYRAKNKEQLKEKAKAHRLYIKQTLEKRELTADRLREIFHYDKETGSFVYLQRKPHSSVVVGEKVNSSPDKDGYASIVVDGKRYKAHRLAWLYVYGSWPAHQIDHINGSRSDNRIENLRDVPLVVNLQNRRSPTAGSKSGLLGAHPGFSPRSRKPRFYSRIKVNGKIVYIGTFRTAEDAHEAYLKAKRELHVGCTI